MKLETNFNIDQVDVLFLLWIYFSLHISLQLLVVYFLQFMHFDFFNIPFLSLILFTTISSDVKYFEVPLMECIWFLITVNIELPSRRLNTLASLMHFPNTSPNNNDPWPLFALVHCQWSREWRLLTLGVFFNIPCKKGTIS